MASGKRVFMRGHKPKANPDGSSKRHPYFEVTKEVKRLEKEGKIKRERVPAHSFFGNHIKRTVLAKK